MKKIFGLSILAIVLIGLVTGGTFAYFSSTQTSTGNTFAAGTLNLTPSTSGTGVLGKYTVTPGGDGLNGNVVFTNIAPGETGSITWNLNNSGTLPGTLTIADNTTFGEGAPPNTAELAADPTNTIGLGQRLMVWVTRNGTDILGATGAYVPMSDLAAALNAESQSMAAAGSLVYVLHWQIPTTVGNEIQGDTAQLDITFTLEQTH